MPTEYSEDDCCFYPDNEAASTTFMGEEVYFEAGNCCVTLPKVKVVELIKGAAECVKNYAKILSSHAVISPITYILQ